MKLSHWVNVKGIEFCLFKGRAITNSHRPRGTQVRAIDKEKIIFNQRTFEIQNMKGILKIDGDAKVIFDSFIIRQ